MSSAPPQPDQLFKACADPTRLRILNLLLQQAELCVCELMDVIRVPQAKMSRHLAYLRKAELVSDRREGQWVYYRLKPPSRAAERKVFDALLAAVAASVGVQPELKQDQRRLKQVGCAEVGCC